MLIFTIDPYILTSDSPRPITFPVSFKKATRFNYLDELYQFYLGVNIVLICKLSFLLPPPPNLFIHGYSVKQNLWLHTYYMHIYTVVHLWYLFISHCYLFIFCATLPKFTLKLSLSLEIKCVAFEDYRFINCGSRRGRWLVICTIRYLLSDLEEMQKSLFSHNFPFTYNTQK